MLFVVFLCQKSYHISTATFPIFLFILLKFVTFTIAKETDIDQQQHQQQQQRVKNCDIVLYSSTSKNGSIQSPNYPGNYPSKTLCRYDFQGKGRERIQITFTEFSLPAIGDIQSCDVADTLRIYFLMRDRYENVDTLCGDTMPKPIMSNGPKMRLDFKGDRGGKGNRGFRADYTFLENFGIMSGRQLTDQLCSFIYNSNESVSGWFHSPNFPGAYPRNIECNYYFYGGINDKVLIRFTYFDVEGIMPCDEYSASDSVELSNFMTTDRKYMRHCGQARDFSIRSDGKFFRITFRSNDRLDGTGFRAFYAFETERPTTEIVPIENNNAIKNNITSFSQVKLTFIVILVIINYIKCYCNL